MELSERTWLRNCCVIRAQEGNCFDSSVTMDEGWNFATRRFHSSWDDSCSKQKTNVCVLLLVL
jgi:hypothetical protein